MGTRSGDVDPGLHRYLSTYGYSAGEIDTILNKQSGMLGLCGLTDMRDVEAKVAEGDEVAIAARDVYVHRLLTYIGSYIAVLGGCDAVVFTAGVGENASFIREAVINRLAYFGVTLDAEANNVRAKRPRRISTEDSTMAALVVPTNEELAMARETLRVIGG